MVQSLNLKVIIYGSDDSNIANLHCVINYYNYIVQNTINIQYLNLQLQTSKCSLVYNLKPLTYYVDSTSIFSKNGYIRTTKGYNDLHSIIVCVPYSTDLNCTLQVYVNPHIDTSAAIPNFIVLKLMNNVEEFRKYVSITLRSYASTYYYF